MTLDEGAMGPLSAGAGNRLAVDPRAAHGAPRRVAHAGLPSMPRGRNASTSTRITKVKTTL
jgi:hypothetical protein